jgi:adenine deaminase
MFCSDDKHPDDLLVGHINLLVSRAMAKGYNFYDVLRAACVRPVEHYRLPLGLLREGDPADFIVVDSLNDMKVFQTWRKGELVFERGGFCWSPQPLGELPNRFFAHYPAEEMYLTQAKNPEKTTVLCIDAIEGQLITKGREIKLSVVDGWIIPNQESDVLHLTVVNHYKEASPANAFISGFGLKNAAISSSVAHDSHNIVAVGSHASFLKKAVDALMHSNGGISIAWEGGCEVVPLPIAGLMSAEKGEVVAARYQELTHIARELGSTPRAPFMLLSFMALLVIPELKLSDLGLFNGLTFAFTPLEVSSELQVDSQ